MTDMEPKKRKSGIRYTKQQAAEHSRILLEAGISDFTTDKHLFKSLVTAYLITKEQLRQYKAKSLFSLIKERLTK